MNNVLKRGYEAKTCYNRYKIVLLPKTSLAIRQRSRHYYGKTILMCCQIVKKFSCQSVEKELNDMLLQDKLLQGKA